MLPCLADIDVRSGHMALKVYYLGLPVYHKTLDLPGPIDKGHFVSSFTEDFPAITPPVSPGPHMLAGRTVLWDIR